MTVIERLKAAGYDPAKALWPVESSIYGSMDCEHIQITTAHCMPRDGMPATKVTATAIVHFSDGGWRPYPVGWPQSEAACVSLFFDVGADLGDLETELWNRDGEFRYRLLSRCIQDCKYFLGAGRRHSKYLWGGNVQSHIKAMQLLWNSFSADEKPIWTNYDEIYAFGCRMKEEEIF